ncbi:MAG: MFS transporter [Propioniciclava sp.]|uniref:MFS transporter n=1 Tax=Propioniciclava sp. TaxID=2038686 RepID=UPI0039E2EE44
MKFSAYSDLWRLPGIRQAVVLGMLGKAPWFGAAVVLTLHVVGELGQSYASAGVLTAVFTLATALASPMRGRMLDRIGLRRTLLPSLLLLPPAFLAAPFLPYTWLLVAMGAVGLMSVPWFSLTRQMVLAAAPLGQRRAAIALDSVVTEMAFIIGPAVGIVAAVSWHSGWTLTVLALLSITAAAVLMWRNPQLASDTAQPDAEASGDRPRGMRAWLSGPVLMTFMGTVAVSFILGGTDLAIVAATRTMDANNWLAIILGVWGAGSLIGGLLYGVLQQRTFGITALLLALAITTIAGALGSTPWLLAALMAVAGFFCAPSLSALTERLGEQVPEINRGEAFGWSGTCSTVGNAMAPPMVGVLMDSFGWQAGFVAAGVIGLVLAGLGWGAMKAGAVGVRRARARLVTAA